MNVQPIAIACGAVIGALGRHYISSLFILSVFPYGTLLVNVLGAFTMGILVEWFALKSAVSQSTQAMLTVGMLGSFTTFSTYTLELVLMLKRHEYLPALGYFIGSTALAVAALLLGMWCISAGFK